jgi:hypothetical protein
MITTILNLGNLVYSSGPVTARGKAAQAKAANRKYDSTTKSMVSIDPNKEELPPQYWSNRAGLASFKGVLGGDKVLYCPGVRDADIGSELRHCVVYYAYGNKDLMAGKGDTFSQVANMVFPLPDAIMDEVGVEWSVEESNQMAMRQMLTTLVQEGVVAGATELYDKATDSISNFISNITGGAGTFRDQGTAKNNHQELYFKGLNFRQFSFKHKMMPTSEKESLEVKQIVDTFQYLASPGYAKSRSHFTYPSQWEVHFLFQDNGMMIQNQHLTRIGRCVLDKVGVNYTSEGTYQSFAGGQPTSIELELSFKEIDLVTKESLSAVGKRGPVGAGDQGMRK